MACTDLLSDLEISRMNDEYNGWFRMYGDAEASVGWNKPKQRSRFDIIYEAIDPLIVEGDTILDLGCGLAHLYEYLKNRGKKVYYCGLDANQDFIEHNKLKHPEAKFICSNVERSVIQSDFIISSGLFNRKFANSSCFVDSMFLLMQKSAKKAYSANYLHFKALAKNGGNYYTRISKLENLVDREYTKGFVIDANSLPGEFTFTGYTT